MPSSDANPPSITIVVPTYQRREMVVDTVRALSDLQYQGEFEILVVVDGSTDGTAAGLAELECAVPLRVLQQENRGLAAARNRGAAGSRNEVLLFLDDDMKATPDLLEQHARCYGEGADAVVGDCPPVIGPGAQLLSGVLSDGRYREGLRLTAFDIFGGHLSVKRSAFEQLGGFDERFNEGGKYGDEDIDFGRRLLDQYKVVHNRQAFCAQQIVVGPSKYIRRAREIASADLYFAAKHPELARELFERRGASRISKSLRLLTAIPLLPRILADLGGRAADASTRTRLGSTRALARIFGASYALAYWSTVRKEGGMLGPASSASSQA
jgi:glycosyltransferase involved in cell wall biosynthesis